MKTCRSFRFGNPGHPVLGPYPDVPVAAFRYGKDTIVRDAVGRTIGKEAAEVAFFAVKAVEPIGGTHPKAALPAFIDGLNAIVG